MFPIRTTLTILILSITSYLSGYTQNLVYNNSFEVYDTCPNYGGQIYYADKWFQPYAVNGNVIAFSSSDYFNTCSTVAGIGVPKNSVGHQMPLTGNAYAGIICFGPGSDNAREYIETKLVTTLKKKSKYCVEFYVSLADTSKFSINRMGAYFSTDSMIINHTIPAWTPPFLLSYIPQVENDPNIILNDKTNWVKISGNFVAQGGEQYITIGNFYDSLSTAIHNEGGSATWAYYYIDDISVILCDTTITNNDCTTIPNAFSPNNDGHNDVFTLQGWKNCVTEFTIIIYDRWGEKVFESNDPEIGWDGTYKGILMDPAVFAYYINATAISGEEIIRKGNISLIR